MVAGHHGIATDFLADEQLVPHVVPNTGGLRELGPSPIADFTGARGSNTGDQFHELWALDQVLSLLDQTTDLKAVTVEGLEAETRAEGESHWDGVDCALYFAGGYSGLRSGRKQEEELGEEKQLPEEDLHWKSSISRLEFGAIGVRGYKLADLIGRVSFTEMIWLVMIGELPRPAVARVMDAVLVSAAEGGGRSPSVLAARTVASCGAPITAAVAAGALAISKYHGGAVEDCMRQLISIREEIAAGAAPREEACRQAVRRRLDRSERLGGFGHRVHKEIDPRMDRLFEVTREAGFQGEYLDLVVGVSRALEAETGRKLPVNIDGADAAVLCEIGFPPELSNPLWMLARSVGMIAHAHEEQTRMRTRRYIHPTDWEYDGPPEREL